MSLPTFPELPEGYNFESSIAQILTSIAMEEIGLSHIINAEGEKIQFVLGTLPEMLITNPPPTVDQVLEVNDSVQDMLRSISFSHMFLNSKMTDALKAYFEYLCITGGGGTGGTGGTGITGGAGILGPIGLSYPIGSAGVLNQPMPQRSASSVGRAGMPRQTVNAGMAGTPAPYSQAGPTGLTGMTRPAVNAGMAGTPAPYNQASPTGLAGMTRPAVNAGMAGTPAPYGQASPAGYAGMPYPAANAGMAGIPAPYSQATPAGYAGMPYPAANAGMAGTPAPYSQATPAGYAGMPYPSANVGMAGTPVPYNQATPTSRAGMPRPAANAGMTNSQVTASTAGLANRAGGDCGCANPPGKMGYAMPSIPAVGGSVTIDGIPWYVADTVNDATGMYKLLMSKQVFASGEPFNATAAGNGYTGSNLQKMAAKIYQGNNSMMRQIAVMPSLGDHAANYATRPTPMPAGAQTADIFFVPTVADVERMGPQAYTFGNVNWWTRSPSAPGQAYIVTPAYISASPVNATNANTVVGVWVKC